MGPHFEPPVAIEGEPAGRRDRGMSDMHPSVARLVTIAGGGGIEPGRPDDAIDRGLLQQPPRLFLKRVDRIDTVPGNVVGRDRGGGFDHRLVRAEDRKKIAIADDLDRPFRAATKRGLVDRIDRRTTAWLAYDTGMRHAVEHHVMDKSRPAKNLGREVDTRGAPADDAIIADRLGRRPTAEMT